MNTHNTDPVDHLEDLETARLAVARQLPDDETDWLADTFRLLSDPNRLRILWALGEGELCVSCVARVVGMAESAVSHALGRLRDARLIRSRREGRTIRYRLADEDVKDFIELAHTHFHHGNGEDGRKAAWGH